MIKLLLLSTVISRAPLAFMSDACAVVEVKGADGERLYVNKSDYDADPKKYKLFKGADKAGVIPSDTATTTETDEVTGEPKTDEEIAAEAARAERIEKINFGVVADGKKFFVVDANDVDEAGKPKIVAELDGIDPNGYKSLKAGWDAVVLVRGENTGAPAGSSTAGKPQTE